MSLTITAPAALDDPTFAAISALVLRCNQAEGLDLPILVEVGSPLSLLLAYLDQRLTGVASFNYNLGAEICLCVDPSDRRAGVGWALAQAAYSLATDHAAHAPRFVCDLAAESGPAFAAAIGAQLSFAEHRMDLDLAAVPPAPAPMPGLHIRPARADDAPAISDILIAAFGDSPELARRFVAERLASRSQRFLLGDLAGRPVATLRLIREDGWVYVTTFGVLPAFQGRGVGRRMLLHTITMLRNAGEAAVRIEVETTNAPAIGLYQSCGFRRARSFAYYGLGRDA